MCFSQSQSAVVVTLTAAAPRLSPLGFNVDFLTLATKNDGSKQKKIQSLFTCVHVSLQSVGRPPLISLCL